MIALTCFVIVFVHITYVVPWRLNKLTAKPHLDCPCLMGNLASRGFSQSAANSNLSGRPTKLMATSISSGVPNRQPVLVSDPSKSVICHRFSPGRLGNHLFEYASILGIARTTNKTFYFQNKGLLLDILKYPPVQTEDREMETRCRKAINLHDKHGCSFDRRLIVLEEGKDYYIGEYLQSWLYFDGMREEMKTLVTFKDDIVQQAEQAIGDLRRLYANTTLVGVHVRRGDLKNPGAVNQGYLVAPVDFFHRAMTYYRHRFHSKVTFLVMSEPKDHQWCVENVKNASQDVVVPEPRSAALDMQILALTDHFIRTVGTYGWWAAFKNPGTPTVVFLEEFVKKGSGIKTWYTDTASDYMLPGWLPMWSLPR